MAAFSPVGLAAKGQPCVSACGRVLPTKSIATAPLGRVCIACDQSIVQRGISW